MRISRKVVLALINIFVSMAVSATVADSVEALSLKGYLPQVNGVVRSRYELDTQDGAGHFNVRNARLSLTENVGRFFTMYVQTDFCDRGKIKLLDAWARVNAGSGVSVQVGQFRMPYGADSFMAPATYYFANRSFIGKDMANFRAVGLQGAWQMDFAPIRLSAGVFNPGNMSNHEKWSKSYSAAVRLEVNTGPWLFTTGYLSHRPDSLRLNMANASVKWQQFGWTLDGEYMYRHAPGCDSHGWLAFADYAHSMRGELFNRWSAQARFDGMTALGEGVPRRNRLTVGATLSHIGPRKMQAHLRLNYEKYFYGHAQPTAEHQSDVLVAELVVSF